jgi:hypothetical protein
MVRTVPGGRMSQFVPGKGEVGHGVGGAIEGGGGVPVSVGVGMGTGVGSGVGIAVGTRDGVTVVVGTAMAEGLGVAGWLPHPAIRAVASVRAPSERRISPPTTAMGQQLRGNG